MKLKNLKMFLVSLLAVFTVGTVAVPLAVPAYAADLKGDACAGLNTFDGSTAPDCSTTASGSNKVNSLVKSIVALLSWIVGIVAVIALIVAGFKYITSGGSSEKVGEAKRALIYALVGILVVVLAQFIVGFAFNTATSGSCPSNPGIPRNSSACR
jgi:hypothetical protein